MSLSPQKDDNVLLASFLRDKLAQDGYLDGNYPSDRALRKYLDDYDASYDLAKARNELEPILPLLRQMVITPRPAGGRAPVAEQIVDRILAALRHMGFDQ